MAPQEFALGWFANPAEARFPRRSRIVNFVAVQAHGGFEAQSVSRAKTAGKHAVRRSLFQKVGPQFLRVIRRKVDLEAVFSRVSGACDEAMDAIRNLRRRTGRIKVGELLSARDEGRRP